MKTIRFEELLGRQVHGPDGKRVGRILAVTVERDGEDCVVREYLLGTAALFTRLGLTAGRLVGVPIKRKPLCIPWDQLDVGDPRKPRLLCPADELKEQTEKKK
jgi:sporulation protein YlmC with PRC-barrel domain